GTRAVMGGNLECSADTRRERCGECRGTEELEKAAAVDCHGTGTSREDFVRFVRVTNLFPSCFRDMRGRLQFGFEKTAAGRTRSGIAEGTFGRDRSDGRSLLLRAHG